MIDIGLRRVAYHEAGHAVIGRCMGRPFSCVQIKGDPRGQDCGSRKPGVAFTDGDANSLESACAHLYSAFAGRVAEGLICVELPLLTYNACGTLNYIKDDGANGKDWPDAVNAYKDVCGWSIPEFFPREIESDESVRTTFFAGFFAEYERVRQMVREPDNAAAIHRLADVLFTCIRLTGEAAIKIIQST